MTADEGQARRQTVTNEAKVLAALDSEEGSDRFGIHELTGLTLSQVSTALQGLRRKGLARCGRWRETHVWWS